jgi:AcrR family transcriptional regulator
VAGAEETRRRLQRHALALFESRGFDQVTVEEVARAAGVSHMTFYRHFPTKESVVLDDPYDPLIGEAVARQDPDLPVVARVADGFVEAWGAEDGPAPDEVRSRLRLAAHHPGLRARAWENNHRTEAVVVDALTATGVDPLEAKVAAGAVLGALTAALFDWAESDHGTLEERIARTLQLLGATGSGVEA